LRWRAPSAALLGDVQGELTLRCLIEIAPAQFDARDLARVICQVRESLCSVLEQLILSAVVDRYRI